MFIVMIAKQNVIPLADITYTVLLNMLLQNATSSNFPTYMFTLIHPRVVSAERPQINDIIVWCNTSKHPNCGILVHYACKLDSPSCLENIFTCITQSLWRFYPNPTCFKRVLPFICYFSNICLRTKLWT